MFEGSVKNQYLAVLLLNFNSINHGLSIGWPSSTFPLLQSTESPLPSGPIVPEELSRVVSIYCLGGLIGSLVFGAIVDRVGRKNSMILASVPGILSWLLILFARDIYYLLFARFSTGICNGGLMASLPIYVTEIAEPKIRGKLESLTLLICYIGVCMAFTLGGYLPYHVCSLIYVFIPIIFLVVVLYLPETPNYLMRRNKMIEAEKSLAFFRNMKEISVNLNQNYLDELICLKERNNENMADNPNNLDNKLKYRNFATTNAKRAILMGVGLVALNQLCGSHVIISYASIIFQDYGANLNANRSALIVSIAQFIGSVLSVFIIDKFKRKVLLTISALGAAIGFTVMGIYIYLKSSNYDVENYSAILLCSFGFVIFICPLGILTLPYVIIFEIMPEKIRGYGSSICVSLLWIFGYLTSNYYYGLTQTIGTHGCMFIFGGFCYVGAALVTPFLVETKGKTLQEIQVSLSR